MTAREPDTPRWARRRLSTLVGAAGAGLIVLVALASAGLVWTIGNLRDANQDARHSEQVLTTALGAERALLDLETGQRGFIITSDPSFLEPWRRGQTAAPRSARELAAMVADNAAQHRRALAIAGAIQSYVDDYSKPLVASVQAGESRARSVAATAAGKRRVDALRTQFDGFTSAERRLLDARTERARSWAPRAIAAAAVMLVVLGGLIVLLVLLARRLVVGPVERVTAAAGRVAGGALDARVEEGGAGEIATLTARFNEMAAALESGEAVRAEQYRELERLRRADVALLDAVFDQSPVGLGLWDGELRFVRVNPALAAIDGVPAEAHIGRRLEEVLPALGASAGGAIRRVLETGEPVLEIELEGETPAAPGELRQWRASYLPIRTDGEASSGVAGLLVDTTEERRAARERERLEAAERAAADRLARLHTVREALIRAVSPADVLAAIEDQGRATARADAVVVALLDESGRHVSIARGDGRAIDIGADGPLAAAAAGATLHLDDPASALAGDLHLGDLQRAGGFAAWRFLPLASGRTALGALGLAYRDAESLEDAAPLIESIGGHAAQALDRAQLLARESMIADTLQRGLLPARLPDVPGFTLAARFAPAGSGIMVGGDFYDAFEVADGRLLLLIGDVVGKGPHAAAVTALLRYTMRALAAREPGPAALLTAANRALTLQRDDFALCTAACVQLTRSERGAELVWASAGHPPGLIVRAGGEVEFTPLGGLVLGLPDLVLEDSALALAPGDGIVLYTDGATDAHAPERMLTPEDLAAALAQRPLASADALAGALYAAALPDGGARPRDDIAILAARLRNGAG